MIVFLNFAPLEYMGGAERRMSEIFNACRNREKIVIYTASAQLAGMYGSLVLNDPFIDRSEGKLIFHAGEQEIIDWVTFIPFSTSWRKFRNALRNARIIYTKCDFNELVLLWMFGGIGIFTKVVATVHSPWIYASPTTFFEQLHNVLYSSFLMGIILRRCKKIHVLTNRDEVMMKKTHHLIHVCVIPNYLEQSHRRRRKKNRNIGLHIVFIGELIHRKGIDILLEMVRFAPSSYTFSIIGNGPLREQVQAYCRDHSECTYYGYVDNQKIQDILNKSDVLVSPSRAEGFPMVILQALRMGLPVVTSPYTQLNLPQNIEFTASSHTTHAYLEELKKVETHIKKGTIQSEKIRAFFQKNFLKEKIQPLWLSQLFNISS